jgi:phosphatidylinositol alpha-1,6-mannosyltransferase
MAKSLLVTTTFPPRTGGRERYLYGIFSRFPPEDVVVVTWDQEGDWKTFDQQSPFRIIRVDESDFYWYYRGRRGRLRWFAFLGALCRRERIDVVHCGVTIPDGMSGWLLKNALGRPYVVYTYAKEILGPWSNEWDERSKERALAEADRIVTISDYTRGKLGELGIDPHRIQIAPPGVDLDTFRPDDDAGRRIRARHGIAVDRPVMLTVARLTPGKRHVLRKGHDMVIDALPAISARLPDVTYLIVGTGSEEARLQALVREKGLSERVIFAGRVPDEDLPAYYNAADIFIMPNREEGTNVEGFGIVFLEANACGKPVIGGRSGGTVDAVADGESGYLVDPRDASEITQATIRLLTDPVLARRMGRAGRERAQREFCWDSTAQQVYALTKEIAATSGAETARLVNPGELTRSIGFFLKRL